MRTVADYRQLNDALFHSGLRSGSQYEFIDEPNRLHFYVIDRLVDGDGIVRYVVGVRSLDGAGPQARGVRVESPPTASIDAANAAAPAFAVTVANTGAAPAAPGGHTRAPAELFASDIYRVSVAVEGAGWQADVQNALVAVGAGESARVPVLVRRTAGTTASSRVTVTVISESDPTKRATSTTAVSR
jgi:hypothetical protein